MTLYAIQDVIVFFSLSSRMMFQTKELAVRGTEVGSMPNKQENNIPSYRAALPGLIGFRDKVSSTDVEWEEF